LQEYYKLVTATQKSVFFLLASVFHTFPGYTVQEVFFVCDVHFICKKSVFKHNVKILYYVKKIAVNVSS